MNIEQRARIEELYLQMYQRMLAYARVNMDSEAMAEEMDQETFRIACQSPEKLCESPNPQGWLILSLKNTIQNTKRNQSRTRKLLEKYLMEQIRNATAQENAKRLFLDIEDLEEFQLLSEMVLEGKSHAEIAHARGITVAACKKRIERAKKSLQKNLCEDAIF